MNQLTASLKRYSLAVGILLMFLLTWPIDLANAGVLPFHIPFVVALLVGYGFVFASLIMTGLTLGKSGVIALLKRFLIWRVGWQWYLVSFLLLPSIYLIALFLNARFSPTPVDFSTVFAHRIFGPTANLVLFIVPFFIFDAVANGEEIGWRGYVLPRLQAKYNALVSSLIVGVIFRSKSQGVVLTNSCTNRSLDSWSSLIDRIGPTEGHLQVVVVTCHTRC